MLNIDTQHLLLQAREHHQAGRRQQAEAAYRQLLAIQPNHSQALFLLGILTHERGQHEAACQLIVDAINADPTVLQYYISLGSILPLTDRARKAVEVLEHALTLAPHSPDVHLHLGCALRHCGRFEDALPYYRRAVELAPTNPDALANLAVGLADLKLWSEAATYYEKTLAVQPDNPRTHWNYALLLLAQGDFTRGWEHYEWRLKSPDMNLDRHFKEPQWDGSDQPDKTVLLYTEGGFGDAIMFIRFLLSLRNTSTRFMLECQPSLVELFSATPAISSVVDRIIPRGEPLPSFDFHLSVCSLPRLQRIRLDNIPNDAPYLTVSTAHRECWASRIPRDSKLNIGLTWKGSTLGVSWRSIPLEQFAPLASIPGVRFFSLQKQNESKPPAGMDWLDYTADFDNWAHTAALVEQLDLVISIDTSIAHLAGALARPTWTLLPTPTDFRWLHDRRDTPWYPTMRLFRQTRMGDWSPVLSEVHAELSKLAKQNP